MSRGFIKKVQSFFKLAIDISKSGDILRLVFVIRSQRRIDAPNKIREEKART